MVKGSSRQIPLPLHCYDESGLIVPPTMLYVCSLWLCKGFLILLVSVSFRDNSTALLELFYPQSIHWYMSMMPALIGIVALVSLSLREKLRERHVNYFQRHVSKILLCGLFVNLVLQSYFVFEANGQFYWSYAAAIALTCALIVYLLRSKHTTLYERDSFSEKQGDSQSLDQSKT